MATSFATAPAAQSVRLISFKTAKVIPAFIPGTYVLIVTGTKPYVNMTVELSPRIYIRRPDYWGIEVVGSLSGIGLPMTAPYSVALPLDGIIGTKGIEVIGSNKSQKFDVPLKATKPKATKRKK